MEFSSHFEELIDLAIREDIGDGDHTSLACIPPSQKGKAKLLVKEDGIISGIEISKYILKKLDADVHIEQFLNDGAAIKKGDIAFLVEGNVIALLQAERLLLNIMQRMSGIATETQRYVAETAGLKTRILSTRKTTPGFRYFEKMAIRHGGGHNHRMGLYDMILIKDNHVDFSGGIVAAVNRAKKYLSDNGKDLKIILEVRSLEDIKKIIDLGGIYRLLLDNFSPEQTKEAVQFIDGRIYTESSGGIRFDQIRAYAECGVDCISVGALTHQIKSLDLSLKAIDY